MRPDCIAIQPSNEPPAPDDVVDEYQPDDIDSEVAADGVDEVSSMAMASSLATPLVMSCWCIANYTSAEGVHPRVWL